MKTFNLRKILRKCGNSPFFFLFTLYLGIQFTLGCGVDVKSIGPEGSSCSRIEGLPGPEDFALDTEEKILYVSSHERRIEDQTGKLFWIDLKQSPTPQPKELPVQFPPEFRPHGISLLKNGSSYRIYAISHPKLYSRHTIEIFERNRDRKWLHVGTLTDPLLTSPNDLFVVSENEIYVSNDHGVGGMARYLLWDDLFGFKRAEISYYDGKTWSNLGHPLSFGNGILHRKDGNGNEFLYRSGYSDRSVFRFKIRRENGKPVLGEPEKIYLNSGTDNLETDSKGRIFVTGHGSSYQFLRHMKNSEYNAPTQVFRISEDGSYKEVFSNQGNLISAGSTAIPFENRLYIAQVFDPFLLNCEFKNED
ncbi:arylesterase [Leptospira gomenensis]|uniref:Arylesterase n=1 Tax=Leptospira gomenensis TaxID=2484974 RepID=A0A5F1YBX9_9LEPT|nr:arylesterase [Leptospira gomenensis]TGK34974.1 arylesterase [Leptospira gomenensis]TGK36769.1 arylesterase [Leptospira gomenensis]TGK48825.1 arylesterase [Leptospira gomenensis]TGK64591.1 arylesterase [Leptospira gomenensis]